MAFAKISTTDTGLRLGLGLLDGSENCMKAGSHRQSQKKKEEGPFQYPSLTLGPPDEANQLATRTESADFNWEASSPSAVSSFSNSSSMKREREFVGEEYEVKVDKIPSSSRVDDLDEDGNPRKKLRLTREQSAVLEDSFKDNTTLNPKQRQELARKLNLRARQVEVWFQNRRARTKVKQTEVEREILKKCCERLREEKERLEKELEELKSVGPFYVEIPAATVSICPACCERICGGREGSSSKAHNLYSSAAC